MTSPIIQKGIVTACKIETVKAILEELNGDYFALLVDESFDISRKEKMAIVLRYVDRMGFVMVRLIDIIQDTSALSLKETIINLLAQHSLSPSRVRGRCYDGASNMQGERMNDLRDSQKAAIQDALDMGELTIVLESLALDARSMDERAKAIKEQDVANAMLLVEVAKKRLQVLRDDEWNSLIAKLNDRFNEVSTDLLHGIACLNPINSISSFDNEK
ncbi:uncharacterized protein LOC125831527 [Solanum verrucosum]|uniref:uncharacterized protein LOC125831527 n=1 Tax=Solanum verrucosum TaxID=315347 RepID=UPI0020D01F7C|nr:uncharacterized protein LOC125831527 [Solanum verrucosum]